MLEGGGTLITDMSYDFDDDTNGTDSKFSDLVIATGGTGGRIENTIYNGKGGTPNGLDGTNNTSNNVLLPNVIGIDNTDYGNYGISNGVLHTESVTRAGDVTSEVTIQGGTGGKITTTILVPAGTYSIIIGKAGQNIARRSSTIIEITSLPGSRNGCVLVEYGEGISL